MVISKHFRAGAVEASAWQEQWAQRNAQLPPVVRTGQVINNSPCLLQVPPIANPTQSQKTERSKGAGRSDQPPRAESGSGGQQGMSSSASGHDPRFTARKRNLPNSHSTLRHHAELPSLEPFYVSSSRRGQRPWDATT